MTLYISDTEKRGKKTTLVYLCTAVFTLIFSAVYEAFSFGVLSNYMIFAFLIPLLGGAALFGILTLLEHKHHGVMPQRTAYNIYNSGIAVLTTGCIMQGVLEIYGTTNILMTVYWLAGSLLLTMGAVIYIISMVVRNSKGEIRNA